MTTPREMLHTVSLVVPRRLSLVALPTYERRIFANVGKNDWAWLNYNIHIIRKEGEMKKSVQPPNFYHRHHWYEIYVSSHSMKKD